MQSNQKIRNSIRRVPYTPLGPGSLHPITSPLFAQRNSSMQPDGDLEPSTFRQLSGQLLLVFTPNIQTGFQQETIPPNSLVSG